MTERQAKAQWVRRIVDEEIANFADFANTFIEVMEIGGEMVTVDMTDRDNGVAAGMEEKELWKAYLKFKEYQAQNPNIVAGYVSPEDMGEVLESEQHD